MVLLVVWAVGLDDTFSLDWYDWRQQAGISPSRSPLSGPDHNMALECDAFRSVVFLFRPVGRSFDPDRGRCPRGKETGRERGGRAVGPEDCRREGMGRDGGS